MTNPTIADTKYRSRLHRVFLVGMPGVGKTYCGSRLAAHLGWYFTDLDAHIVDHEGCSIVELFQKSGEAGFRELEQGALQRVVQMDALPHIVACGGGTPCYGENMAVMRQHGYVVYLEATIPYIMRNIGSDTTVRPLLEAGDGEDLLANLLAARSPVYQQADIILQVADISLATFAETINRCINQH